MNNLHNSINSCIFVKNTMKKYNGRIGEKHITNEGYEVEIIEYISAVKCKIKFIKSGHIKSNIKYSDLKKGKVKNPYHPSVYGIGYFGVGKYSSQKNGKHTNHYKTWTSILERCYSLRFKDNSSTYLGCSVAEDWYNFQNFAEWYEKNYNSNTMQGWHLDKDILFKGNKIYSPETCCFVPASINILFVRGESHRGKYLIGVYKNRNNYTAYIHRGGRKVTMGTYEVEKEAFEVYKAAKEVYIKEEADKWKDKITLKVYEAMINYQVEIAD